MGFGAVGLGFWDVLGLGLLSFRDHGVGGRQPPASRRRGTRGRPALWRARFKTFFRSIASARLFGHVIVVRTPSVIIAILVYNNHNTR